MSSPVMPFDNNLRLEGAESTSNLNTLKPTPSESERDVLKNEKYYKKFDFFYRRTAFRTMTEYYKGLFKPNLDRFREIEKKLSKGDFQPTETPKSLFVK